MTIALSGGRWFGGLVSLATALVVTACASDSDEPKDVLGTGSAAGTDGDGGTSMWGTGGSMSAGNGGTGGSGTGGMTASGGGTGEIFDCNTIALPPEPTVLAGPPGNRGVAFDGDGLMISGTTEGLFRSTTTSSQIMAPGIDASRGQIRRLPDGDFVVAAGFGEGLIRVTPDGAQSSIHSQYGHYAVRLGPDGMLYASEPDSGRTLSRVARIDPNTGDTSVILELENSGGYDVIRDLEFSPEADVLYLATEGSSLLKVDLDSDLNPTGAPTEFVNVAGVDNGLFSCDDTCKIEAIAVDICGNVYASLLLAHTLVRISSDGSDIVELYTVWDPDEPLYIAPFPHGISWGPPNGTEFKNDALYLALPFFVDEDGDPHPSVSELQVGVPPRTWRGTAINK